MKGQVLVAIAIIVSIVVLLIGIEADYVSSLHRKEIKAGKDIVNTLENLKSEYSRIPVISLSKDSTLSNLNKNIMDFTAFVDGELSSKQSLLFYSATRAKNDEIKIAVGNFLGEDVVDVTVRQNLTNEDMEVGEIGVGGSETIDFNVSGNSPGNYRVNITYEGASSGTHHEEVYTGEIDSKERFVTYYNLKISLEDSFVIDKFQINEYL